MRRLIVEEAIEDITIARLIEDGRKTKPVSRKKVFSRSLVDKFGRRDTAGFDRIESKPPKFSPKEIYGLLPEDTIKQYDMYEVIARIVDHSEIDEYKGGYGKTVITAYARIDGWAVGIVANQRSVVKDRVR